MNYISGVKKASNCNAANKNIKEIGDKSYEEDI